METVNGNQFITKEKWMKIIENADSETLKYLDEHAFDNWRLFINNKFYDAKHINEIKEAVWKRLNDQDIQQWFLETFF
jgi:hypothetical protein